ncbi:MAG: chromosome segregation protein SMC [Oscillospiraceae bacterium]|nr:chromosome segregation protein SMC [Oscillospiraceae bacterium]
MYLKALEIQGFKSFPDKTVLQFGSDITAIVGPNGSGKSNISDAISWVMGEQSTKALRGAKMEDVIFGGTQKRAQVGFAEASLILDNSDGALRIETPEVMVTRRYYRSGDSEYYINKQSARLRDINELFMDTGLGREGYSNIGQGRIDEILSVKSTDRREVFEEAAGISKFRHRKEETERRLDSTQENLVRIGDKIAELELQVEPLREQAEKAQKYLACRSELKRLEVSMWLDSLERLAAASQKAEEDYNAAAFILEQEHENLTALYNTAEQLGQELRQRDQETEILRGRAAALEDDVRAKEGEVAVLEANLENNRRNMDRIRAELQEQESRAGGITEQIVQKKARLEALSRQQDETAEKLAQLQTETQSAGMALDAVLTEQASLQLTQTNAAAQCASRRRELDSLALSVDEQAQRRAQLTGQQAQAQAHLEKARAEQKVWTDRLSAAREDVTAARNTIDGYSLRMQARAEKRDRLQKEADASGVQLDTIESKLKMFREMEREYEGYSKAVRVVMQAAARGVLRNVHGPVSKLLKTQDRYTVAVETALGAAMQHIVVSAEEDGKAAIQLLRQRDGGRATFLPVRTIWGKRLQESGVEHTGGFVGVASDLIEYDRGYDAIFQNLLGRTVVVENLDYAIIMARKYANRFRIVTLDGQVINAGGAMTGGSTARSAGILSRANELQRLEQQRRTLSERREALGQALSEAVRAAAEVEFQLSAVQGQLRQAEDEVLRLEGTEKQQALLVEAAELQAENCRRELAALDTQSADATERQTALSAEIASLERQVLGLDGQLAQIQERRGALEARSAALQEETTAVRMAAAACEAERGTAQESIAQLCALAQDMQGDRAAKEALLDRCEAENGAFVQQIEDLAAQRDGLSRQLVETRSALQDAAAQRMETEARKTKAEREAQEKNRDILLMERESARLEQRKTTAAMEEKQIIDKLWDAYELTPTTAAAERAPLESAAAAGKEIAALKRRISALGTPNLGAIDEFARVNERYEYLSAQRDDVLHAKAELEEIIGSITREMTEIFAREFARINEYFGKTFVEMFGGGKASLELEDPEDPLGCGIEIRVQPPGKQLKTITLLSGGEKAFVAIALYFAILRVRPTPFCLLDEIDAALDDNNVRRFASYLRNLCGCTQFIVITHRRGTMEEADVLYGVTMQEQGISKILHIDLGQMERQLGIQ